MPKMRYKSRMKYLPDRVFHKLWDIAGECDSISIFMERITSVSSKDRIRFYASYKIAEEEAAELLDNIWCYRHMSFKELFDSTHLTQSQFRHMYCIPRQTMTDWLNGTYECKSYIILMILKLQGKLILGRRISLESERREDTDNELKEEQSEQPEEDAPAGFTAPGGAVFEDEEEWLRYIDHAIENIH